MDKNQKAQLLQSKLSEICERIDKDYVRASKLNGSKEDVLEEIEKLLFSYENDWRNLENYFKEKELEKHFEIGKARQWFVSHEHKLIKLKQGLEKEIKVKKNDSGKAKERKKNKTKTQPTQTPNQNNICWECHKTESKKWYINQETNLEFCSQACNLEHNAELCENCVQKCLKHENGVAVDYQVYYRDSEKKTGVLCFNCKQKQKKELEEELEKLQQEQEADKEEMERLRKLIDNSDDDGENSNNNSIEREREREQIQTNMNQLKSEIKDLETNSNKSSENQAQLEEKKQQLQELETKMQELNKSLPLDTQISNLEKEIKVLESKSNKTSEENSLLAEKKQELERLLAEKNKESSNTAKPKDKTALYVGGAITGILALLLIFILASNRKRKLKH